MSNRINLNRFYSGFTDFYVNSEPNSYQTILNMNIEPDGSLKLRAGGIYDSQYSTDIRSNGKAKKLVSYLNGTHLLSFIKNKGYVIQPGASTWTEIVGPASGAVFHSGTTFTEAAKVVAQEFRGEVYLIGTDPSAATQQYSYPMKIYKDNTSPNNVIRVVRSGLPKMEQFTSSQLATYLSSAITLANDIRSCMSAHFSRTTITIGTADIDYGTETITLASHGLVNGNLIRITTNTQLPTGLAAATNYYVISATANTFQLSAVPFGAAIAIAPNGGNDNIILTTHSASPTTLFTVSEANMDFTTNTFTQTAHGLLDGVGVVVFTTSQPPTGLVATGLVYYVVGATANTFQLAATVGGAAIDISDSGSGGADTVSIARAHNYTFVAAASNEATLIALTKDLMLAYDAHVPDARTDVRFYSSSYHNIDTLVSGANRYFGNFNRTARANPETLLECIPILNDLKICFNLHINAWDRSNPDYMQHIRLTDRVTTNIINLDLSVSSVAGNSAFGNIDTGTAPDSTSITGWLYGLILNFDAHVIDAVGAGGHADVNTTAGGSQAFYSVASRTLLTSNVTTDGFLINFYKLFHAEEAHINNAVAHTGSGVPTEIPTLAATLTQTNGASTHLVRFDLEDPSDALAISEGFSDLGVRLNTHVGTTPRHLAGGGTLTGYSAGVFTVLTDDTYTWGKWGYAILYRNEYFKNDGVKVVDQSTPMYISTKVYTADFTANPGNSYNPLSSVFPKVYNFVGLSSLFLGSSNNNPSTTATIDIYRTTLNGNLYYKVATISNTTTTYTDNLSDADLITREPLYSNGDLPENDPPPKCNCFAIVNNCGWYGDYIEEVRSSTGTDVENRYKNRFRQSVQNDIDSCPEDFYGEVQDDIIAIAGIKNIPILLCYGSIYRIEGIFGEDGSGGANPILISDRVGALSANGGVTVNDIHYFAGHDGFYACDGYVVKNISKHIRISYRADVVNASGQIHATYDKVRYRVYWTAGASNDIVYVLNLPLISADFGGFTKWGNSSQFEAYTISAHGNKIYRIGKSGHLYTHDDVTTPFPFSPATYDTFINNDGTVTSGFVAPINWRLRTSALSHTLLGDFKSNISATFVFRPTIHNVLGSPYYNSLFVNPRADNDLTDYDGTGATNFMAPIRYLGASGVTGLTDRKGLIKEKRYFGRSSTTKNSGIRTLYTQIDLCPPTIETEASTIYLGNSSDSGVLVDVSAATVTLQSLNWGAVLNKETQLNDYLFYFGDDGTDGPYTVTAFTSTTATLNSSPTTQGTGLSWQVKGQPKMQLPHLDSIIIDVDPGFKAGTPPPSDGGGL